MVIYSHSRLSTFEQCPLKFKYRYIDKIIPEVEHTIESFLGGVVHDSLEWLYLEVKAGKIPTLDELILYYSNNWEKNYTPDIKIVRNGNGFSMKDYFNKGVKFLLNYYLKHQPFDDNTLEVEKKILINLDQEGRYKLQGFIDRLAHNPQTGEYEIHDYKTANNLPNKEKIDTDKQLAFYALGIKNLFGEEKKVKLIWHYLAHGIKITSQRTNEELQKLKEETIELIKRIELTEEFNPCKSILCNWCEYKTMCPLFGGKPYEKQNKLDIFD